MVNKFRLNKSQSRIVILSLVIAFLVQSLAASWPHISFDEKWHLNWCRVLVNEGLEAGYWDSSTLRESGFSINYPPIYPYTLYLIGKVYNLFSPESFKTNDALLDFFIKLPAIISNIIISILIFIFLNKKTGFKTAFIAMSAFALNPAIIFCTSYWGQVDAINCLFVFLSIIFLSNNKPEWSWVSITLGVFTKPLAYPFAPIVALFTFKQFGIERTLRCVLASIIVTFLIFLPFIHINRLTDIIYNLLIQIDTHPYLSANAHNIWWIIEIGVPWVNANIKPFGLISYKLIGIAIFAVFYIISILRFWKSNNGDSLYYLCASVAFGFFILSTHMHERHLYTLFPFLSMIYFHDKRLTWIYVILTFTSLANMVLHDPTIILSLKPLSSGIMMIAPDDRGGYMSLTRTFLTLFNTQINILTFCYWIYYFYFKKDVFFTENRIRKDKTLDQFHLVKIAALIILVISITSAPFVVKVARLAKEHYFVFNLDTANIQTTNDNYVVTSSFNINNDIRYVIFEHPPSKITYKLTIPENSSLIFGIALKPETWSTDKGDGVTFEILAKVGTNERKLFSKYIDPKNNEEDRKWHDEILDLSEYGSKVVNLSFITKPGFRNNTDYDWAGWSSPRLAQFKPPSK